jgi:hypothetical protein
MPVQDLIKFTDKDASRIPVVLDNIDPEDWIANDTLEVVYNGIAFARDDNDHTSLPDLISVIKSYDEVRFKSTGVRSPERGMVSVIDFVNEPPADVAKGDIYGVNAAPTGDFADYANQIAICVKSAPAAIFRFTIPPWPGFLAYNRASGKFKTWTGAVWQDGLNQSFATASVPPEALVVPRFIVQDVLATPPATPADGQYWLAAATGCTGEWVGWENRIIKRVGAAWVSLVPSSGWTAAVLSAGRDRIFIAGAWSSASNPLIVAYPTRLTRASTIQLPAATGDNNPPAQDVAPTTALGAQIFPEGADASGNTKKVQKIGNRLVISGYIVNKTVGAGVIVLGTFIDGQVTADPYNFVSAGVVANDMVYYEFEITPPDTNNHVYRLRGISGNMIIQRATMQFREITQ